jgi:MFS family permease
MSTAAIAGVVPHDNARARRNGFLGAYLGWLFDGYETFATVLVAAFIVNDLVGPDASKAHPLYVGGILAATLVAWAIGGLASGILADRFGRRRVMLFSILWYAVFAGLTALSPSYFLLIVLRFFTGLGMGAEWGGGSSLVAELSPPEKRGRRIALLQSGFGVGFIIATGLWQVVNNGNPGDWRWMYVFGIVPALLTFFIRRNVEDSEIWQEADRQRREATPGSELAKPSVSQLLSNPTHRKQVLLLIVAAFGSMLGWWAVSTLIPQFAASKLLGHVSDLPGSITLVVLSYNVAGVIGYLTMGWVADKIGRKPTMLVYFVGSIIMTPLLFSVPDSRDSLMAFAFLNGFFTLGQMTWLALYPSEVFPTNIRATGMTFVFNIVRFPVAVGALLTSQLITAFHGIPTAAIVMGCIAYGIGAVMTPFIGRETRGAPLPSVDGVADVAGPATLDRELSRA